MNATQPDVSVGHRLRRSLRATLGLGLAASVLSGVVACERDTTAAGSSSQAAPAAGAPQPQAHRALLPTTLQSVSVTARAWWNQPQLIEALSLAPEQRAKMDALLLQSIATQRAAQQQQHEQQRALKEALEAGKWDAARQAATAAAEGMSTAWRAQTNLKIDVLALLDAEQQRLVTSQYRQVLRQTSVLTRLRGNARRLPLTPDE
jgi:Spy/CpxP family protein refolding chaperone